MSLDFSIFLKQSTLIFFLLLFVILIIFLIACFFVIKAIFKFIKSLLKKESKEFEMKGGMSDKGEDLEVNVEQLERSKEETAKIQKQTQPTITYNQPITNKETTEPEKSSEAKQQWSDKEKQDISAGLGKLKGEEGAGEKKSFLERQSSDSSAMPKIKIPVSRKLNNKTINRDNLKLTEAIVPEYTKKDHQTKNEEISFFKKPDFIKKGTKLAQDKNKKDSSIFGEKEEISRSELRTKLFGDASVAKAQRELYMNLSPVERAKLEKSVFKSSYGLNISKSDLKNNLKRMGREWASTSDMNKKETLRKQIKFFKKIGGIK